MVEKLTAGTPKLNHVAAKTSVAPSTKSLERLDSEIEATTRALDSLPFSPASKARRTELKQNLETLVAQREKVARATPVSKGISDAEFSMLKGKMELLRSSLEKTQSVPPKRSTLASNDEGYLVCRQQADLLARFLRGEKISVDTFELPALAQPVGKLPPGFEVKVVGNRNRIADLPWFAGADTQHAWVEVRKGKDVVTLDMWANKSMRGEAPAGYALSLVERATTYRSDFKPLE